MAILISNVLDFKAKKEYYQTYREMFYNDKRGNLSEK